MIPRRSIVLVYYREPDYLRSVLAALSVDFPGATETEVIVVDNASGDTMREEVARRWPNTTWVSSSTNRYYAGGNNLGVAQARGEWVMILNCDVAWKPGDLRQFVERVEARPELQLVAPVLQYPDGRIQISAHRSFPSLASVFVDYCLPFQLLLMKFGHHPMQLTPGQHRTGFVAHITGVCLYVRRSTFERSGGFDTNYTMYLEETDWQHRLVAMGARPYLLDDIHMTHFGSAKKRWAQATPFFLTSLKIYTTRWWRPQSQALLWPMIWLAAGLSWVFLLLLLIPSWFIRSARGRVQHYIRQYGLLLRNLLHL